MYPTTEHGSPDEGPEGLRWALASLCPVLCDPVGGRSAVKCAKGVGPWRVRCTTNPRNNSLLSTTPSEAEGGGITRNATWGEMLPALSPP